MKKSFGIAISVALIMGFAMMSCEKEKAGPIIADEPVQPSMEEQFSLVGTSWMDYCDSVLTPTMHLIDTIIWQFVTDTDGVILTHDIINGYDYGTESFKMRYAFDAVTKKGWVSNGRTQTAFAYHPEDTTLVCYEWGSVFHFLPE